MKMTEIGRGVRVPSAPLDPPMQDWSLRYGFFLDTQTKVNKVSKKLMMLARFLAHLTE